MPAAFLPGTWDFLAPSSQHSATAHSVLIMHVMTGGTG